MPGEVPSATEPVVLHFPTPTRREALRFHARGLATFRSAAVLLSLLFVPWIVVEAALSDPGATLRIFAMCVGGGSCAMMVLLGGLAAVLQRVPPTTLLLSEDDVIQEIRGVRRHRGWSWIFDVSEDAEILTLHVPAPPARSLRLVSPEPQRLLIPKAALGEDTLARLRARGRGRRA